MLCVDQKFPLSKLSSSGHFPHPKATVGILFALPVTQYCETARPHCSYSNNS